MTDQDIALTPIPNNDYPKSNGATQIVDHISSAVTEVHNHTLNMIVDLTRRLDFLKLQIENEKQATILKFANYVELSNETLLLTDNIKYKVGEIEDSLIKGHS